MESVMDVKRIVVIAGCLSALGGCYSAPYSPDTGYTQSGYYGGGYAAAPAYYAQPPAYYQAPYSNGYYGVAPGYYAPPVSISVRPER
jgi:hypothetical protein